jgi:hypothetical protein
LIEDGTYPGLEAAVEEEMKNREFLVEEEPEPDPNMEGVPNGEEETENNKDPVDEEKASGKKPSSKKEEVPA